jgi:hypothetical protein
MGQTCLPNTTHKQGTLSNNNEGHRTSAALCAVRVTRRNLCGMAVTLRPAPPMRRAFIHVVVVVLVLGLVAAGDPTRVFSANIGRSAPEQEFQNDILTKCVGSSHASTALRADW